MSRPLILREENRDTKEAVITIILIDPVGMGMREEGGAGEGGGESRGGKESMKLEHGKKWEKDHKLVKGKTW